MRNEYHIVQSVGIIIKDPIKTWQPFFDEPNDVEKKKELRLKKLKRIMEEDE